MAVAGKEIGRLTVRVLPDTDQFRRDLKAALESMNEEFKVPVSADTSGFRQEVSAAVDAAEAGQKIDVPVDVDKKHVQEAVEKAVDIDVPKIPIDVDRKNLDIDLDEIVTGIKTIEPELDTTNFEARMRDLLKPVELPIEMDSADQSIKRELDRIDSLGVLEIPMHVDTTGFSKEALQARADAAKILEKNQLRLKLTAQDDDLRQRLGRARAELKELQELGVSPKYDSNALRQAQTDLQRYLMKLDELQKKKTYTTDQQGQFAKLKMDLEYAWQQSEKLRKQFEKIQANPIVDKQGDYATEVAKKFSDAYFKAVNLEKKIRDIEASKKDPKIDLDIADLLRKIDTAEGRIREFKALGGTIQYDADVDKAIANVRKLEAESARVLSQRSKIDFEVDATNLENARRIMRETSDNEVRLLSNRLAEAKTVMIDIGREADPLSTKIMKLGRESGSTGTKILELGDNSEDTGRKFNIGARAAGFFQGILGRISEGAASLGNRIQAIQALVGQLVSTFLTLPTIAFALSVAGAGLTAVWGALATAIAAINPLIALLGASFGVIYLGVDGIKKAFKQLTPELGRLKVAASQAFEKGLQPAVENIRKIFPTVLQAVKGIAPALARMAVGLSEVLVQADRAGTLKNIFENVRDAVKDITPGLKNILDSMLQVMSLKSGYDALTGAINAFGAAFQQSARRTIADGSLNKAFQGLEQVLSSLSRALVGLVENGLRSFSTAAPGVSRFIDSLTGFFGRFNWERLGTSVSDVFDGLGETLDKVPDDTIEAITKAFEDLGKVFQDEDFQKNLTNIIDAIPEAIGFLTWLTDAFDNIGSAISTVIGWFSAVWDWLQKVADFFSGGANPDWAPANASFPNPFGDWSIPKSILDWFSGKSSGDDQTFTVSLDSTNFDAALSASVANFNSAMDALTSKASSTVASLNAGFVNGFTALTGVVIIQSQVMNDAWTQQLFNMSQTAFNSLGTIGTYFDNAFLRISTATITQLALINAVWLGQLFQMSQTAFNTLDAIGLYFDNAFLRIVTAVMTQMALVNATWAQQLFTMATTAFNTLQTIQTYFTNSLLAISTIVLSQMALVNAVWTQSLFTMAVTTTATLAVIVAAFQMSSSQILSIVSTTFMMLPVVIAGALAGAVGAVVSGMASMLSSVGSGMANIASRYATGWSEILGAARSALANIVRAVLDGIKEMSTVTNFSELVGKWRDGFFRVMGAAKEGASNVVNAVKAQLPAGLREAGANAVSALASAISSGASRVIAAATDIARRAIAAAKSALGIASPSREFLSIGAFVVAGWANGIRQNAIQLVSQIRTTARSAIAEATRLAPALERALAVQSPDGLTIADMFSDAPAAARAIASLAGTEITAAVESEGYGDVGDKVAAELAKWGIAIDANGVAKMVNKKNNADARRR